MRVVYLQCLCLKLPPGFTSYWQHWWYISIGTSLFFSLFLMMCTSYIFTLLLWTISNHCCTKVQRGFSFFIHVLLCACNVFLYFCPGGQGFFFFAPSPTDIWSPVLSWLLIGQLGFFGTGHQAIFSTLHWKAAFVGARANSPPMALGALRWPSRGSYRPRMLASATPSIPCNTFHLSLVRAKVDAGEHSKGDCDLM